MTDETTMIWVTHGPYRDSRLTVTKSEAQEAISAGWAMDMASDDYRKRNVADPKDDDGKPLEPLKQLSDEERAKVVEAAEKAARKLRGEDKEQKAMHPDHGGEYQTRDMAPKRKS